MYTTLRMLFEGREPQKQVRMAAISEKEREKTRALRLIGRRASGSPLSWV
jgi:hypothetical protein